MHVLRREAAYRVLEQRKELGADPALQWLPAELGVLSDMKRYQHDISMTYRNFTGFEPLPQVSSSLYVLQALFGRPGELSALVDELRSHPSEVEDIICGVPQELSRRILDDQPEVGRQHLVGFRRTIETHLGGTASSTLR